MKIELKNIQIQKTRNGDTFRFSADLYINEYKAATVDNNNNKKYTEYYPYTVKGQKLIKDAQDWCKSLPNDVYVKGGTKVEKPMNLIRYIDKIIENHFNDLAVKEFDRKFKRDMDAGIVFGIPGKYYKVLKLANSIEKLLLIRNGDEYLRQAIHRVQSGLMRNERILNTNIPSYIMSLPPKSKIEFNSEFLRKLKRNDISNRLLREGTKTIGRKK